MSALKVGPSGRIRRVVVVAPSAFTLGNLFFGVWAIVSGARGNLTQAAWFVVLAGLMDVLDGRVARLSRSGTRFGAELDSLVDMVSFGVAPAMLMYFVEFENAGRFGWLLCYLYTVAAALRLARFNVATSGLSTPGWFTGLPSPAAGMTLAVYYPWSQTQWYQRSLELLDLQQQGLTLLVILIAVLMVSTVKYPRWPRIGIRSLRGWLGLIMTVGILAGAILIPESFLFPLGVAYVLFGVIRFLVLGFLERVEPNRNHPSDTHQEPS